MAVTNEDLARLVVSLEVTTTKYFNALRKAQQQTNNSAGNIEKRLQNMSRNIDRTFAGLGQRLASNITGPLASIGAAFSVREVLKYADAWTAAGNQLAASSDITGVQARSLEDLRRVADDSRAGFEETVKLYTRIQRSAADVAKSEEDIARATGIVNKAFKAGGAATSEFNAGILQLSQGLGSGVLQGDELRSVRENAPVLAKVIADYFGVTIAGLKELGSQGKLTSEEVFKAILAGEKQIESAFATTQSTISDGFTRVQNALIEYIGSADQTLGVTIALNAGLRALADDFGTFADAALKVAAIIAGALVGKALTVMIGSTLGAAAAVSSLVKAMATASRGGASFTTILKAAGVAAGPIATVLGGLAFFTLQELASSSITSAKNISSITDEMDALGIISRTTTSEIREQASATDELTEAQKRLNAAQKERDVKSSIDAERDLRFGNFADNLAGSLGGPFTTAIEDLKSFNTVATRAREESTNIFSGLSQSSKTALNDISNLAKGVRDGSVASEEATRRLREIQQQPLDAEVLKYIDTFDRLLIKLDQVAFRQKELGTSTSLVQLQNELADTVEYAGDLAGTLSDFASDEQRIAFEDAIKQLAIEIREGGVTATEAEARLSSLAGISGSFGNFLPGLQELINKLKEASTEAANLSQFGVINEASASIANRPRGQVGEARREAKAREQAVQDFISKQREINALSQEERNIREEIDRIIKDSKGTPNLNFGNKPYENEELKALAAENLALKESDKASNKSAKDSERDLQKFRDTLFEQERSNRLLEEELALRAGLNPLIEDYGYALEKWRKEQELLNAAEDAGIALTPDLEQKIGLIAEAYASGTAALEKLQETQDKAKESLQEWLDLAKSATRSFIDDLIEGKSAAEALSNVLSQLGSYLIDLGLNTIFGGGGGGLGIFGSLFGGGGGFGGFRERGGPVSRGQAYIVGEKRPEVFVPNQNGVIIPRVPTSNGGGSITTPVNINIDATGADSDGLARVQQELVNLRAQVPYLVRQQVSKRTQKGW
jgi:tape measure domain-containing protein